MAGRNSRRSTAETAAAIASVRAERPDATTADIARAVGMSDRHVRHVLTQHAAGHDH
jgi:predicted transcriptional regulator